MITAFPAASFAVKVAVTEEPEVTVPAETLTSEVKRWVDREVKRWVDRSVDLSMSVTVKFLGSPSGYLGE